MPKERGVSRQKNLHQSYILMHADDLLVILQQHACLSRTCRVDIRPKQLRIARRDSRGREQEWKLWRSLSTERESIENCRPPDPSV